LSLPRKEGWRLAIGAGGGLRRGASRNSGRAEDPGSRAAVLRVSLAARPATRRSALCAAVRRCTRDRADRATRHAAALGCGGAEDGERAGEQDGGGGVTKFELGHDLTSLGLSSEARVTTGGGIFRLGLVRQRSGDARLSARQF